MVFHWSLSDSKTPQVSRTRLRILVVLSNAVIWIVSTRPPTSKSSRPFNNPLVIVPKAPITIGTIVTVMLLSFFNSLTRSRYLSLIAFRTIPINLGKRLGELVGWLVGWLVGLILWHVNFVGYSMRNHFTHIK